MSEICVPHHDYTANVLTGLLCIGITVSYLPQHRRIIEAKSSEGFSPWFLLLGSTSSASGLLNMIVMQWGIVKCCRVLSVGDCLESTAGIFQLSLQWFLFVMILVLYMIYYPPHLKFVEVELDMHDSRPPHHIKTPVMSDDWRLSIILSWVVFLHIVSITFVTFLLLGTNPSPDAPQQERQISIWATFLGVTAALLSAMQYIPQLWHTYRLKLVGALSIKMMLMQSPGSIFMVLSIALRPGTNWTTWIPYAVAGALQATLLTMCLFWRARQRRLGIDDFGKRKDDVSSPVSVTRGPDEGLLVEDAVDAAVETDVRSLVDDEQNGEETPLLKQGRQSGDGHRVGGWLKRFIRRR
ncbi:hypothetical protein B0H21DRAFT_763138 [Amylocystis lapponica]|nr:hypothetical protein B0H21DRAFT_763138 [Amylocystis lapponica]